MGVGGSAIEADVGLVPGHRGGEAVSADEAVSEHPASCARVYAYARLLNVIEDEELGVTLAAAVGVMEKAPPGDSGGAFVVGLAC